MEETLQCITNTGCYLLKLGVGKGQMLLRYEPTSHNVKASERVHVEEWNSEQIRDFVRKLGFIDKEKAEGVQIKRFLSLNQVKYTHKTLTIINCNFLFLKFRRCRSCWGSI